MSTWASVKTAHKISLSEGIGAFGALLATTTPTTAPIIGAFGKYLLASLAKSANDDYSQTLSCKYKTSATPEALYAIAKAIARDWWLRGVGGRRSTVTREIFGGVRYTPTAPNISHARQAEPPPVSPHRTFIFFHF